MSPTTRLGDITIGQIEQLYVNVVVLLAFLAVIGFAAYWGFRGGRAFYRRLNRSPP